MKRSPGWGIDGAFAAYLRMPERLLHRIPDTMSYELAAVVEPTANTVHDVIERARVEAGDFVVVLGPGPIGLLAAMTARAAGAREVVVVGTPADEAIRLKKARQPRLPSRSTSATEDPLDVVQDMTGGLGADLVIECSGAAGRHRLHGGPGPQEGPHLRHRALARPTVPFPWDKAAFKVCDIIFNLSTSYTSWDRTIHLIAAGRIPAGEVISHRMPLAEWRRAFDEIEAQRALKVLLIPE